MTYELVAAPTILQFLGPQGSGKGTQLAQLREVLVPELPVATMGNLLRAEKATGSALGRKIAALIDQGHMVTIDLWEPVLEQFLSTTDLSHGLFLDGVVRSDEQLQSFTRIRERLGLPDFYIINIEVPEDESVKRLLLRGRHDDTDVAIRERLGWSRQETAPIITAYRARGQVIDIDGNHPIEAVHQQILTRLTEAGLIRTTHAG